MHGSTLWGQQGCEAKNGAEMGGTTVEQLGHDIHGSFGAFGFLGGNCADGIDHWGANGTSMKEEGAKDFLDAFDVVGNKRRGSVGIWGTLCLDTALGLDPSAGRTLGWIGAFNAARDGDIAGAFNLVKGKGMALALLGTPIEAGGTE